MACYRGALQAGGRYAHLVQLQNQSQNWAWSKFLPQAENPWYS